MQVAQPTALEATFLPEVAPPKETPLNIETAANFKSQPLAPITQATFDHSPEDYRNSQPPK
jgi:chromosome segregation ATPase